MPEIKEKFATSTPVTITLASLASAALAGQESLAIDNSATLYLDALVQAKVTLQAGAPASDKAVYIYAAGSEDGTKFPDPATGLDAAITLRDPTNLRLVGVIATPTSGALTYVSNPISVASAFGGMLPRKWSVVIRNFSGVTLTATSTDNAVTYTGLTATVL